MLARINKSYVPVFWDDFFNDNFFGYGNGDRNGARKPSVNIVEENNAYQIEMAVPGLSKKDIDKALSIFEKLGKKLKII